MPEIIQLGIAILGIPALFLLAVFTFWVGNRLYFSGKAIFDTGIAPAGSGFYGGLPEDEKTHRAIGCFFMVVAYCWYLWGIIALIVLAFYMLMIVGWVLSQ